MTGEQLKGQQQSEQQGQEEFMAAVAASTGGANGANSGGGAGGGGGFSRPKDKDSSSAGSKNSNPFLRDLHDELSGPYLQGTLTDPFLLYLLGVVELHLAKLGTVTMGGAAPLPTTPLQILLQSVSINPLNWSCWLEIVHLCVSEQRGPPP